MVVHGELGYPTGLEPSLITSNNLNEATRWMCARVLVDRKVARLVFERLCIPAIGSVAPSPGIDLPALARHAAWAIDDERHVLGWVSALLSLAAVAMCASGLFMLISGPWLMTALAGLVLLAWTVGWFLEREASRHGLGRRVVDGAGLPMSRELVLLDQLQRLELANDGNLLVYRERRSRTTGPASTVFPGFGRLAGHEVRVPVDVGCPIEPSQPLGHIVPHELLTHLARAVPSHIDQTEILHDNPTGVVAHVLAADVPSLPELVDGTDGPLHRQAPTDFVRRAADAPRRGVRAYVRAQAVGHGGHLVTTLHLSATVGSTGMSLNFVLHVLPPLHHAWAAAEDVPAGAWSRRWRLAGQSATWRQLVRAPDEWWLLRRLQRRARRPARTSVRRRVTRRTRPPGADAYAAGIGLRWLACFNSGLRFNEDVDLQRQANDLMRAVFTETKAFLEARNIDTAGLREDEREVMQAVTTNVTNVIGAIFEGEQRIEGNLDASVHYLQGEGAVSR